MSLDEVSALAEADLVAMGSRIRGARRQRSMTQDDLALNDMSPTYISRIEAGQRRPDLAVARLIAERLGTTVAFLATGVEPEDADEARLALRYAELALKSGEAVDAEAQLQKLLDNPTNLGALLDEARNASRVRSRSPGSLTRGDYRTRAN